MADATDALTLQELADETGVEPRTIRSYVDKGVLPGPESLGRGARYPRETLHRLQVRKLVRDANRNLSLDQIRELLQRLDAATIRAIDGGRQRIGAVIDTDALGLSTSPSAASSTPNNLLSSTASATPSASCSRKDPPHDRFRHQRPRARTLRPPRPR